MGPDPLLTCPLDESHRILTSRMQFHLVRCSKNNNLGMRLKCPWNPLHIVDKFAYEDHYKRDCEDMPGAMESICPTEESRDVGSVPATSTNGLLPPSEEDWDAEPGPVGTYDPVKNAEGKPVLRVAVGLSKAQKKQYKLAERRRFQELEANGPIQSPQRSEEPKQSKELRPPLTMCKALSTNTSMMEDLNSSKFSEIDRNSVKDRKPHRELRPPHEPSLTLSYKGEVSSGENVVRRKSISSEDGACEFDQLPNLCQSLANTFHDSMSITSSTYSHDPNETSRRSRENNAGIPNLNDSLACFSEAEISAYLDEAAYIPDLIGPAAQPKVDDMTELEHRVAALTTMKKKIDNTTDIMIQQMESYSFDLPELVDSTASINQLDVTHDDGNRDDNIPPTKKQCAFVDGLAKCAASFPSPANDAPWSIGRGMVMAYDSFEGNRPGPTPEGIYIGVHIKGSCPRKVSTNPFETPEEAAGAKNSKKTYTLSVANTDDDDSEDGNENAD